MELTQRERDVVGEVLYAYSQQWQKYAKEYPDDRFRPSMLAAYFAGESVVTLQNRNDVLGDEIA